MAGADASGSFHDDIAASGWGRLLVRTEGTGAHSAFAAGYLEGVLTANRVVEHLSNVMGAKKWNPMPAALQVFVESTDVWARSQIASADPSDSYWAAARFLYEQLDGLLDGMNTQMSTGHRISRVDLLMLNMAWDLDDITLAINETERVNFDEMSTSALSLYVQARSHCSSIVKLVADGSELFAGHNSWMGYQNMLRIFKRYELGARHIAMSSYPGVISSTDDFYQMGQLVAMETALLVYNNELYGVVSPDSLPFWMRAMIANRLATNGPEWMETFQKHNSGTYNNQWIVVDYSKFTPGHPLPNGVLTIGEQLPGYFHYEDQTHVLAYGYWPSYNAAVYPETRRLSRQDIMAERRGAAFAYSTQPRANVFRRDQGTIATDEDMQRVMRYNRFDTDPLAKGSPCNQLACRGDLVTDVSKRGAFGAIDAKYTSFAHARAGQTVVVSGPTHDDQPVFNWHRT